VTDRRAGVFAVSAQDITERRHAEEELRVLREHLAERVVRDPLTGLANLVLLEERLRSAVGIPVPAGGIEVVVGVSIGLAVAVAGQAEVGALLGQADDRMYRQAARPLSAHRPGSRHNVREVDPCEPLAVASRLATG